MSEEFKAQLIEIIEHLDPRLYSQGREDVESVVRAGGGSFEGLVSILNNQHAEMGIKQAACWFLGRLNKAGGSALQSVLLNRNESRYVRAEAARSLGLLGDEQAIAFLSGVMGNDDDVEVRLGAAYALGLLIDNHASVEALSHVLENRQVEPGLRGLAAESLANAKDYRAIGPLITALSDDSVEVRFWASFALGKLVPLQFIPRQLEVLATTDESILPGWGSVNNTAAEAIKQIKLRQDTDNNGNAK